MGNFVFSNGKLGFFQPLGPFFARDFRAFLNYFHQTENLWPEDFGCLP